MLGPETRQSLLIQLRDPSQHRAWAEFVEIYRPLILRVAQSKGLQHADAEDLTQEVFAQVGRTIERFDFDASKGSFRGWLSRMTRNLTINFLTRSRQPRGVGGSESDLVLDAEAHLPPEVSTWFDFEFRREVFRWASQRIRERVTDDTWQAFWLTGVKGLSIESVAQQLNKSPGAIRIARCRVLTKLRNEVKRFEQ